MYVLAVGTFLMLTTEFVVAGLLPEIAGDLQVSVAQAGLLITVFAVGMIVGAPSMALLTRRMPRRVTLMLALGGVRGRARRRRARLQLPAAAGGPVRDGLGDRGVLVGGVGGRHPRRRAGRQRPRAGAGRAPAACSPTSSACRSGAFAGQLSGWRGPFWALAVLALAAVPLIARHVPHDGADQQPVSLRSELGALRSGRLWLVLAACATTTGGVLSVYSYVSPLLTDRAGIAAGLVPLVLVGFGVGSLVGTVLGGRLGDVRPHATTIAVAAATTVVLLAICLLSAHAVPTVVLVGPARARRAQRQPGAVVAGRPLRRRGSHAGSGDVGRRRTTSAPRSAPGSPARPSAPPSGRPARPWSAPSSPRSP